MPPRAPSARDCARALWLLGLEAPVSRTEVVVAWRARVARTHPDRHAASADRTRAAEVLTRALNDARATLDGWIAEGRPWPAAGGGDSAVRFDEPDPWPARRPAPPVRRVDRRTGLRAGDRVRVHPYDGAVETVTGTYVDEEDDARVWVALDGTSAERAERVRLAAFSCPVCGTCAGPAVDEPAVRPCPDCLVDLRRLERGPAEAGRVRRAIEARATGGMVVAEGLDDGRLRGQAEERRRWARRLRLSDEEELHAALLERFSRAWERWGAVVG